MEGLSWATHLVDLGGYLLMVRKGRVAVKVDGLLLIKLTVRIFRTKPMSTPRVRIATCLSLDP